MFPKNAILMAPEPGAGGGTGGSLPSEMPSEWADQILTRVSKEFQKALSSRDLQADKKREADQAAFKKMIEEALAGNQSGNSDPDPGKGGKPAKSGKDDVEMATLRKKLDELTQRSETFEKQAAAERAKGRQMNLTQIVTTALAAHGIEGNRARAAMALLEKEGRIAYEDDESETVVFRGEEGVALALDMGLRQWVKGEDAKIYLPSSGSRGSGSRPGGSAPGANGKVDPKQIGTILNDLIDRNL